MKHSDQAHSMQGTEFRYSALAEDELAGRVILQIGYPSAQAVSAEVLSQIECAVAQGIRLARPAWRSRTDPLIACGNDGFESPELKVLSLQWARLVSCLPEPRVLCSFVVTLGASIDERISRDQETSVFSAYLLDAVGSVLAEDLADRFSRHMADILGEEDIKTTERFSPGYCDWELGEGQEQIFRVLDPETIGLRCTAGGLMLPRKSISACLVGAPEVPVRFPCGSCSQAACDHRRESRRIRECEPITTGDENE